MKLLIDLNVVLDVLLDRQPHVAASASVLASIETGKAEGVIAGHALTTLYYLVQKQVGAKRARQTVRTLLSTFEVAAVDARVLAAALDCDCPDFEDCVSAAAAASFGCQFLVTRDVKGFRNAAVRPVTPETALQIIQHSELRLK